MSYRYFIGIDNGVKSGGLAILDQTGHILAHRSMPWKSGWMGPCLDGEALDEWLFEHGMYQMVKKDVLVILEIPEGAQDYNAAISMFSCAASIVAHLDARNYQLVCVTAIQWQRDLIRAKSNGQTIHRPDEKHGNVDPKKADVIIPGILTPWRKAYDDDTKMMMAEAARHAWPNYSFANIGAKGKPLSSLNQGALDAAGIALWMQRGVAQGLIDPGKMLADRLAVKAERKEEKLAARRRRKEKKNKQRPNTPINPS